ncbi:MAG: DegT/DnrJ/EryC1/StrS family aminotransferase [Myxococcales bacterium]|nr:DegT/DnrJ/EryC1/StrS family aminotransferase [Myxococcales bacterium]
MGRIYLSAPHMGGAEIGFVNEAFETNWLSSVGPNIAAFEEELGAVVDGHCAALASGTAALHLGLRLLGVGPGDEVVCPTLTFVATANPIVYQGARPVFIDSERESWNLDPALLAEWLEGRAKAGRLPRAVIVVHLFGQSADFDRVREACGRWDVPILEDAAEALGTTYRGQPVGALGDIGVLSFNGNKIITTTGGGALVSKDEEKVKKARFWATQARDPSIAYEHSELGYNYRMSNVLAGIGRGQLQVLPERVRRRREIAFAYRDAFADLDGLELMPQADWGLHTNWLSVFTVDPARLGCDRTALIEALAADDIEARPVWKPMHTQRLYADAEAIGGSVAEGCYERGICLPSSTNMTEAEQERVIARLRQRVLR